MTQAKTWQAGLTVSRMCGVGPPADAQSPGSFTWQLRSLCSRVTVNVRQDDPVYTLDDRVDQCGAGLEEAMPPLVARGAVGQPETVRYHVLPTLLLAEIRRLERERTLLSERVSALEPRLNAASVPGGR